MSGMHKQSKAKARKHLADMSAPSPEQDVAWRKPPRDECEEAVYPSNLPGADPENDKLTIRMVHHRVTYQLVEFALVQLTSVRGRWVEVAEADSCHDIDAHVHQCGRDAGGRTGEASTLIDIQDIDGVAGAYDVALEHMDKSWVTHKDRWNHG